MDQSLAFERLPASYIHPDRAAEVFPELEAGLARAILLTPRFAARTSDLIIEHYSLPALTEMPAEDAVIALLPFDQLRMVYHLAGACYHASSLRTVIGKERLSELFDGLGDWAYRAAIGLSGFVAPVGQQSPGPVLTKATLMGDGLSCFRVWLDSLPNSVALRVLLKFPKNFEEAAIPAAFRDVGARLTRAAAAAVISKLNERESNDGFH